jgi:hypothetical protein
LGLQSINNYSKGKVVKVHAMKACRGVDVQFHSLFTSALEGDNWVALLRRHFTRGGNSSKYTVDRRLGRHHSQSGLFGEKSVL